MNKESLAKARAIIIGGLNKDTKIDPQDKAELMINLWLLLEDDKYDNNIQALRRNDQKQKRR